MDKDYYKMIEEVPWVMKILSKLPEIRGHTPMPINKETIILMSDVLYYRTSNDSYLKMSSEPLLESVYTSIKFIYDLLHTEDLSKMQGYSTFNKSAGMCFGEYRYNWIFQQFLFYKLTSTKQ